MQEEHASADRSCDCVTFSQWTVPMQPDHWLVGFTDVDLHLKLFSLCVVVKMTACYLLEPFVSVF